MSAQKEVKTIDVTNLKVIKTLSLPVFRQKTGEENYVVLKSKFFDGKEGRPDDQGEVKQGADVIRVIDLQGDTSQEMELLANSVFRNTLEKAFPENDYVDQAIRFTKSKVDGKRYFAYAIDLIENPLK